MSIDGIKELPQRTCALLSIGDFYLEGESYTLSIPGSLADVFAWLADEIPVTAYDYLRELIGDTLILYRPGPFPGTKEPFIGLYGFRRVIEDNRSAFTIIYSPEGERSAALLMARLGSAFGAPWQGFWKQKLLPESAAHAAEPPKPKNIHCPRKGTKPFIRWQAVWRKVKGYYKSGDKSYRELSEMTGVGETTIADIVRAGIEGYLD